jgi:two-component system, cell cycle response regulator
MTILDLKNIPPDHNKKILIVDDDPFILELLGIFISSFGYEFAAAEDGTQAVEQLKQDKFTIVITDMKMPRMDGMQLLRHIKENYPGIDVIVVTGYTGTFSYTDVIKAGASDFISKPFNADELEAKLNRIIREQMIMRELEHISMYDALTNLFNRRNFDQKLWEEAHRAHRQGYDLYLALVDVDKFKEYNDTFGHQEGDKLLQAVGRILNDCVRENVDWNFRYGGDEFAIIIPQAGKDQVIHVAERILEHYRRLNFIKTSLSIGLARFIRHEERAWQEDLTDLISRSDRALYQAKSQGRNQVIHDASRNKP